jgi:hypothetical protein
MGFYHQPGGSSTIILMGATMKRTEADINERIQQLEAQLRRRATRQRASEMYSKDPWHDRSVQVIEDAIEALEEQQEGLGD